MSRTQGTVAAAVLTLSGCGAPCPEGEVYELGEPRLIVIYDVALKMPRTITTYPDAKCEEARRG